MSNLLEKEIIDIIQLKNSSYVSNITFFKLIESFGSVENAIKTIPNFFKNKKIKLYPRDKAIQDFEECKESNVSIITYKSLNYPKLLNNIEDKPPILYAKGDISLFKTTIFAIVGTRNPSLNGISIADKLTKQLSALGLTIASGMALGIDTIAHKASLSNGTIAVLGSGLNVIYPKQNTELFNQIVNKGLVVSEFNINTPPAAYNFPKRNRLISGMSHGLLVVEASIKSGSLITARMALEQNREIFAVPFSPNDTNSQGGNKLIKEGAYLVESISDILPYVNKWKVNTKVFNEEQDIFTSKYDTSFYKESLNMSSTTPTQNEDYENYINISDDVQTYLLNMLTKTPISLNLIFRESGLNSKSLSLAILELELSGKITRLPGNKICLL